MFVDSCSTPRQVITTFYIFLQQSKTDKGQQDLGNLQLSTKIYKIYKCGTNRFGPIRCRFL